VGARRLAHPFNLTWTSAAPDAQVAEADYFTSVAISVANADLAYEYLIGHARWFGQPPGAALLRFLSDYRASSGR
jgi:hypothetical protein